MDWGALLKLLAPYIGAIGGGALLDEQQAKNTINPLDALTGSTAKGIYGQQNRYNDMQQAYQQSVGNATTNPVANPALQAARNDFSMRANTPTSQPAQFNPYASNPNQGKTDPALMSRLLGMATWQNQSPVQQQGRSTLMDVMQQRFKPRPMGG